MQVLRYEFNGSPLLYSKSDTVGNIWAYLGSAHGAHSSNKKVTTLRNPASIPRCGNCGAERVFELQLTPHAISELEAGEEGIDGMEWEIVVLGVCGKDCEQKGVGAGQVGWVQEWVGVQWEEVGRK